MHPLMQFLKDKWWVFACFCLALWLVIIYEKGNPIEVFVLFLVYSIADFSMLLMASSWQKGNARQAGRFHLVGCSLFCFIFTYQGILHNEWHYAYFNGLFLLGAFKSYSLNTLRQKRLEWVNWKTGTTLQVLVLLGMLLTGTGPDKWVNWLEALGLAGFSVVLLLPERDFQSKQGRINNWLAVLTIGLLVSSSFLNAYQQWHSGHLKALPIALTLFAFCVWLEFFKGLMIKSPPQRI